MVLGKRKEGRGLSFFFLALARSGRFFLSFVSLSLSALSPHLYMATISSSWALEAARREPWSTMTTAVPSQVAGGAGEGDELDAAGAAPAATATGLLLLPRAPHAAPAAAGRGGGRVGGQGRLVTPGRRGRRAGARAGIFVLFFGGVRPSVVRSLSCLSLSLHFPHPTTLTWPPARAAHSLPPSGVASHCLARPPTPPAHTLPDPRPTPIQGGLPARPAAWERASAQKGGWWPRGARATPRRSLPSPPPKMNECV